MRLFTASMFLLHTLISPTASATQSIDLVVQPTLFSGQLHYVDYGSGKPVSIPMDFTISQSADGKYLLIDKVYTDPGYKVFSLSVMRVDFEHSAIEETTFENDKQVIHRYTIEAFHYESPQEWTMVRSALKSDDNRDAKITVTESISSSGFRSESRVDYLSTPEVETLRRNWIEASTVD